MNRLERETSSYLRTAAHQPVDWHPWSAEAFERAAKEDKPILLDIGAVWCHWCHVMDRESYEDATTAALINQHFIAIKVDRDERPDVDARYQKAIQSLTGQGGWPLTAFLLADGRPFYGGTYYPPVDAHGRPSFKRVLQAISEAHRERRHEILHNAEALTQHVHEARSGHAHGDHTHDLRETLDGTVAQMQRNFDAQFGGFGRAPKFPHPSGHDFLLSAALRGSAAAEDMLVTTLDAMRRGGMYDQLAGGFHRYSVDREWHVPHFEKMLYDNAGLLRNYARAALALDNEEYRATAREIRDFLRDVLGQPEGGFGGSQDADIDLDDDGDHFTWTLEELRNAISDEPLAKLMAMHYGVVEQGKMHHDPRRNVLRIEVDAETIAAAQKRPLAAVRADLARGDALMREARAKRPVPFVDPIRYTSWNAMAIGALFEMNDAEADRMARDALDVFLREAYEPARGFARTPRGHAFGFLDDNAHMLDALLEAHHATGEARYLATAREVADVLLEHFPHPDGGFVDRAATLAPPAETSTLTVPERPIQDAPTASGNGVALAALLRLADASGEPRYREAAEASLSALADDAAHLALFGGALLIALDRMSRGAPRIVVPVGEAAPFREAAREFPWLGATFAARDDAALPDEARAYRGEGALVCIGTRCLAPAATPVELRARLWDVSRGA